MKRVLHMVRPFAFVAALVVLTSSSPQAAWSAECAYWQRQYNAAQYAQNYYEWACYQYGGENCDIAQDLFVQLGNIGNLLDQMGCYNEY
jgi:hypothetical protein